MSCTSRALVGQADAHGAPVDARAVMVQIADIDELLDVVGDVGAEIAPAQRQLADRQLVGPDIEQNQRLDVVDVLNAQTVEFSPHEFEKLAMQPLDQRDHIEI